MSASILPPLSEIVAALRPMVTPGITTLLEERRRSASMLWMSGNSRPLAVLTMESRLSSEVPPLPLRPTMYFVRSSVLRPSVPSRAGRGPLKFTESVPVALLPSISTVAFWKATVWLPHSSWP